MKAIILASGSSGNSTLIEHKGRFILLEAGITLKELVGCFKKYGTPEALFITHEHSDHVKSSGAVGRKFKIPVYLLSGCYEQKQKIFNNVKVQFIDPGIKESVKLFDDELEISSFSTQHDCRGGSVGFIITDLVANKKLCYLTDTGSFTRLMYERTKDCDAYILESDYDEELLEKTAEYDELLKQRIKSDFGHLSNAQVIDFCSRLDLNKIQFIALVHLSRVTNNHTKVKEMFDKAFPTYQNIFIEPLGQELKIY